MTEQPTDRMNQEHRLHHTLLLGVPEWGRPRGAGEDLLSERACSRCLGDRGKEVSVPKALRSLNKPGRPTYQGDPVRVEGTKSHLRDKLRAGQK